MSEQNQDVECGMCGRDGGTFVGCSTCHGRGGNVPAQYTLSQHRSGRAPKENRYESLEPRQPNLPGTQGSG